MDRLRQSRDILADHFGRFAAVFADQLDNRRADHHAIGDARDRRRLLGGADAESDHDGQVGRGLEPGDCLVAAMPGPLLARARVIKLGGTLATAEAQLYDEHDALIASGRGVYLTRSR